MKSHSDSVNQSSSIFQYTFVLSSGGCLTKLARSYDETIDPIHSDISDTDTTWLNGKEIGRTDSFENTRRYNVPSGIARGGRNVITLRITNAGGGGIHDKDMPMRIHPLGAENAAIALSGPWRFQETARQ